MLMVPETQTNLTVAVTGPTGTLGFGFMPLLQADDRVARVIGVARRPFDPASRGARSTPPRTAGQRLSTGAVTSATLRCCATRSVKLTSWCTWRSR